MYFDIPDTIKTVCPYCDHVETTRRTGDIYSGVGTCSRCLCEFAYKLKIDVVSTSSKVQWLPAKSVLPKKTIIKDIPKTPITDLEMTVRTTNCLLADGIDSVEKLLLKTEVGLLRLPQMGRKSVKETKDTLASRGLSLSTKHR